MRAEERIRLSHQGSVGLELLWFHLQRLRAVREKIEADRSPAVRIEIQRRRVASCIYGTVNQRLKIGALEGRARPLAGGGLKCRGELPLTRDREAGIHGNLPHEIAGGVEQHGIPFQYQDVAADLLATDLGARW